MITGTKISFMAPFVFAWVARKQSLIVMFNNHLQKRDSLTVSFIPCRLNVGLLQLRGVSVDVFAEAHLAREVSLIFEALRGFSEHAQCAALGTVESRAEAGVIPSAACVSVQSTYSWLWGQLTPLVFLFSFFAPRRTFISESKRTDIRENISPRGSVSLSLYRSKVEAGPSAFWLQRRRREKLLCLKISTTVR